MRKKVLAVTLILGLGLGTVFAAAGGGQAEPLGRARLRERIGDLYLLRLTRALDLTEDQTAKLYPLLVRAEKDKADLQSRLNLDMRDLRAELAKARPKEETLVLLTNGVREAREGIRRIEAEVEASLDRVLTPLQKARYLLFAADFLRSIGERLERVRGLRAPLKRSP
jgi:Spy/CpxP family protein refolding chaperone